MTAVTMQAEVAGAQDKPAITRVVLAGIGAIALAALAVVGLASPAGTVDLIANTVGAGSGSAGPFQKIIDAIDKLITPTLLVMAAATPLAVIAGLGMSQMGNRRGIAIAGGAVAALVVAGAAKGIVT